MHGMNQTKAEYPRHSKRSQTASLSSISLVVFAILQNAYLLRMRRIGHVTILKLETYNDALAMPVTDIYILVPHLLRYVPWTWFAR